MPKDMGYEAGYSSTPSVKPTHGDYGGTFGSTPASNAGASGRAYVTGKPSRNPKQKDAKGATGGYHNTSAGGSPGIQSGAGRVKKMGY
jgi:hypothetical protein